MPIDDTHTGVLRVYKLRKDETLAPLNRAAIHAGKTWFELDAEGHQRFNRPPNLHRLTSTPGSPRVPRMA